MSQAAAQQPSRKKTVISLLVLLALTCIIVFTFKDHWAEITAALAQLSVWQVLAVLAVGISYPLLEGCVAWVIVRSRLPQGAFADSKRSRNLCAGIQKPPAGGTLPGHCRAVGNQGMREHGIYRGPGRRLPHAGVQSQIFRRRGVFLSGGI